MLNIKIICVGKIREKATKDLLAEYEKRISKYAKLETIELEDEKRRMEQRICLDADGCFAGRNAMRERHGGGDDAGALGK